ncbi:MAG: hypothetical protein ACN6O7_04970 [Sphingobacterium sp.]
MNKIIYLGVTQFLDEHKKIVDINLIYKDIPRFLKPIRKLVFDFNLPFKEVWLSKNFKEIIAKYDIIILAATLFNVRIVNIIDSYKFHNKRLIFWYWNPVEKICLPSKISNSWEKWSFDKKDCEKYNLFYNNTYYFKEFVLENIEPPKYQVSFIGQDKGRLRKLLNLEKEFLKNGISSYFHIVKDRTSDLEYNYKGRLSYDGILDIIRSSKVLLDIVQEGQSGLTLRIMESLFFSKKIITNNVDIEKYDFYSSENIFILGKDPEEGLCTFIETQYMPIEKQILEGYTVNNWLNNFLKANG